MIPAELAGLFTPSTLIAVSLFLWRVLVRLDRIETELSSLRKAVDTHLLKHDLGVE